MSANKPLGWEAWLTLSLIIVGGFLLVRDIAPADMVFLGVNAILMISGVITVTQGSSGFASSGVLTVGILMVCSYGLTATGGLGYFMSKLLGNPKNVNQALIRILLPIGLCSSFINDTPVFLMFVPIFQSWFPKLNDFADVRQFYLPMSFVCLLAGTVTLIGTSTNIVVAGKVATTYPKLVLPLFGITPVGIPVLFYGLAFIIAFAEFLLPNRHTDKEGSGGLVPAFLKRDKKEVLASEIPVAEKVEGFNLGAMTLSAIVNSDSPAIGKSINDAGLRNLRDIFLVAITRGDLVLHAVGPDVTINAGDLLSFAGNPDHFVEIAKQNSFTPVTEDGTNGEIDSRGASRLLDGHLTSVIIRDGSSFIGKTPKDLNFRSAFDASIISVQRAGKDLRDKPYGQIELQVGDILVLLTGERFKVADDSKDLKILHSNSKLSPRAGENENDFSSYVVGAKVISRPRLPLTQSLKGKTIDQAGLKGLVGVTIVGISRPNTPGTSIASLKVGDSDNITVIRNPPPTERLQEGDVVWFSGGREAIFTVRKVPGLELVSESQASKLKARSEQRRLVEVVIAPHSDIVGATLKEIRFRTRYGAAIVAIRRGVNDPSEELGNVADVRLQVGDVLMLDASPDFIPRHGKDPNFLITSELVKSSPPQFGKFYLAFITFVAMFVTFVASETKISLVPLGFIGAGVMVTFRVLTPQQARAAVDWETLVVIAAASGLSSAMENSGLATAIGSGLVDLAVKTGSGEAGIISALYIATMLISLFVANNAAALLMFTIGAAAQKKYGLDPYKMIYTIMLAASASFLIPYGYQTNIMCLTLGPYTPKQFMKLGIPLQIFLTPLSIFTMIYMEQWWINVAISLILFFIAVSYVWCRKPKFIPHQTGLNEKELQLV